MTNRRGVCIIPECDEPVRYFHLQTCAACYAGLSTWRGRSKADKEFRLARNVRLVSRMDFIMDNPKHHAKRMPYKRKRR